MTLDVTNRSPHSRMPAKVRQTDLGAGVRKSSLSLSTDAERGEIRAALHRILLTEEFAASKRLSAFLTYVVDQTLAGKADQIKEYTVAVEALGRGHHHDPQTDPGVRILAGRLRRALAIYNSGPGATDPIEIEIPKGRYVPNFKRTDPGKVSMAMSPRDAAYATHHPAPSGDRVHHQRLIFNQISTMAARVADAASAIVATRINGSTTLLGSHGMVPIACGFNFCVCDKLDSQKPFVVVDDVATEERLRGHSIQEIQPRVKRLVCIPFQLSAEQPGCIVAFDQSPDTVIDSKLGSLLCELATMAAAEVGMMGTSTTQSIDLPTT